MKKNLLIIGIVGVLVIIGIIGIVIKILNEKNILIDSEKSFQDKIQGLGSLCSNEEECVSFCQNNRGQCEKYCQGNDNELCKIIFPPATAPEPPREEPSVEEQRDVEIQEGCEGTKTKFDYPPVNLDKTLIMLPRGLMVGDHVTPVNHHYFQNFDNEEYDIEVYSSGKGVITGIGHMPNAQEGKDYLITIQHTCTISSDYIYVSNLPEKLRKPLEGHSEGAYVQIPVESGELIGYYKNNLDYNLIDKEVTLTGFVVPEHYALEPYKINIVRDTYEYFNEPVKSKLIEKSVRTAEPISGKIDYDIDGKLVGNWFVEGTNFYNPDPRGHLGHLSIVYDYIDPKRVIISIGGYGGEDSKQFAVKGNSPDPKDIGIENGLVKYELVPAEYITEDGKLWDRTSFAKISKTVESGTVSGTVLIQMISDRKIKFETFPGKTISQVSGFTSNAKIYER